MRYAFTDDAGTILGESAITSRMPSASAAFEHGENAMDIIKAAKKAGATRVYALHNHPSGDPTPSPADITFTTALSNIVRSNGLTFKGHVVMNHKTYTLIDELGNAKPRTLDHVTGDDPLRRDDPTGYAGMKVTGMRDFAEIGRDIVDQTPENSVAIITTDTKGKITLMTVVPNEAVSSKRAGGALVRATRMSRGSQNIAVTSRAAFDSQKLAFDKAITSGLLTDVLVSNPDGTYRSAGNELGIGFKRKASDVLDRKGDTSASGIRVYEPPSRRPGESQAQYANRILRKDKAATDAAPASDARNCGASARRTRCFSRSCCFVRNDAGCAASCVPALVAEAWSECYTAEWCE
jgi:proteasome lid subunit RPN8/RPN11